MYSSTGSGPSRSMRARRRTRSGLSPSALDIGRFPNAPPGGADHEHAGQHHRQRIEDARSEGSDGEEMSGIGLAEELAKRTRQAVTDQEGTGRQAGSAQCELAVCEPPQNGKQYDPFRQRFIDLARVAWNVAGFRYRKYHRPRHGAGATPELAVDEVGEPAEEQAHGGRRRGEVHHAPWVGADAPCEQHHGGDRAQERAVEGHAAVPNRDDLQGMGGEESRLIEEDVAQATAQQHADRHEQQEIVHPLRCEWALLARPEPALLKQRLDIKAAEQQTGHVGKAIPLYCQGPDPQGDRVDGRIGDGEDVHRAQLSAGVTAVKEPDAGPRWQDVGPANLRQGNLKEISKEIASQGSPAEAKRTRDGLMPAS